jgi:hypothetical protein
MADSAGITLVRNPERGLWSAAHQWQFEEQYSVGVATGDPELEFGYISALDVGSDGSVYLLDRQARQIHVLDSTGQAGPSFAGPGNGPGELGPGTSSLLIGPGDTLIIPDPLARLVHVYLPSGQSAGDLPFHQGNGIAVSWAAAPTGGFTYRFFSPQWDGLRHYASLENPPDTLLRFEYPPPMAQTSGDPRAGTLRMTIDPLAVMPAWALFPDGRIAAGTTNAYRISIYRPDGTLERVITGPRGRRAITATDKESIQALMSRQQEARGVPQQIRDAISLALPDSFPAFASFAAGPEETLWVQQIAAPEDMDPAGLGETSYELLGSRVWDIFDREGRYLGSITFPYAVRSLQVRGDLVYGVTKGSSDEDKVVCMRVLKEPGLP